MTERPLSPRQTCRTALASRRPERNRFASAAFQGPCPLREASAARGSASSHGPAAAPATFPRSPKRSLDALAEAGFETSRGRPCAGAVDGRRRGLPTPGLGRRPAAGPTSRLSPTRGRRAGFELMFRRQAPRASAPARAFRAVPFSVLSRADSSRARPRGSSSRPGEPRARGVSSCFATIQGNRGRFVHGAGHGRPTKQLDELLADAIAASFLRGLRAPRCRVVFSWRGQQRRPRCPDGPELADPDRNPGAIVRRGRPRGWCATGFWEPPRGPSTRAGKLIGPDRGQSLLAVAFGRPPCLVQRAPTGPAGPRS